MAVRCISFQEKNAISADVLKGLNVSEARYVEPWRQAASGPDLFQPYGADMRGNQV